MSTRSTGVRRLQWTLGVTWSVAWLGGLALFTTVLLTQEGQLRQQASESDLAIRASAVYGLVWFDADGRARTEALDVEPWLHDGTIEIWIIEPGSPPVRHVAPQSSRVDVTSLERIAEEVVARNEEVAGQLDDLPYLALPTYPEGPATQPHAAILTVGAPVPVGAGPLARSAIVLAAVLGVAGIAVGVLLARWSVRPLVRTLRQRERFLIASAHELRSPIASLRAVCESGVAGDEPAEVALQRADRLSRETAERVDELLLYARLDAGQAQIHKELVRLDLLVESLCDTHVAVEVGEEAPSPVELDPKLVRVAVRNLIENARLHGNAQEEDLHVTVRGARVTVRDAGPGYPPDVLDLLASAAPFLPSTVGAGVGLATVCMIAELHGGGTAFENAPGGGAMATIDLSPDGSPRRT